MAGYGDIKTQKFLHAIRWLQHHKGVRVVAGGRHNIKVECIRNGNSYPLPTSHRAINKHIVKHFVSWLVKNDICTKKEFDRQL